MKIIVLFYIVLQCVVFTGELVGLFDLSLYYLLLPTFVFLGLIVLGVGYTLYIVRQDFRINILDEEKIF